MGFRTELYKGRLLPQLWIFHFVAHDQLTSGYKYALPTIRNTHFIFKLYSPYLCLFSTKVLRNCFRTSLISNYIFIIVIICVLVCFTVSQITNCFVLQRTKRR